MACRHLPAAAQPQRIRLRRLTANRAPRSPQSSREHAPSLPAARWTPIPLRTLFPPRIPVALRRWPRRRRPGQLLGMEGLLARNPAAAAGPDPGVPRRAHSIRPAPNGWCSSSWPAAPVISTSSTTNPPWSNTTAKPSDFGEPVEAFQDGLGPWKAPVWPFRPYGRCGKMLSDVVAPLGAVVDELAFVHNMVSRSGVHSAGTLPADHRLSPPGFPRLRLLGELRPRLAERQPAHLRRPPRPPRLRLERHQELGQRLPPRPAPGRHPSTREPSIPSPTSAPARGLPVPRLRTRRPPGDARLNRVHAASRPRR
jgi:hypothetical protein